MELSPVPCYAAPARLALRSRPAGQPGLPKKAGLREATPMGRCGGARGEATHLVSLSFV